MTNIFEETYEAMEEAKKAYAAATTDESKEAAEKAYGEAKYRMADKGDIAWRIWRAYEHSRENENKILNFDDIIWDRDVEAITACLKENGIREFTSARWSRSTSGKTSGARPTRRDTHSR